MITIDGTSTSWHSLSGFRRSALGAFVIAFTLLVFASTSADAQTRALKLYNIHTKERAEITFMRNGRMEMREINRFLRDWRQNEPTDMDQRLINLLWEVYQHVGASEPIHIVSAYRSPRTNNMLRSRSSGVADNSQHTRGKAIDFYIPGVKLSTLRAMGLRMEGGGVGYYPRSGAPFVHLDVGNVRHWPRMRRNDLMAVFPDGRTIHTPSDGKPLPGYQQALAAYESRKRSGEFALASAGGRSGGGGGLLATLFGGGGNSGSGGQAASGSDPISPASTRSPTPSAPVTRPQPESAPVTPETIIAALPARSVPVPAAAPRPQLAVGDSPAVPTVASAALADAFDGATAAAPARPASAETLVAAAVPLPTPRPDYSPAADPATESAGMVVASVETPADGAPLAALLAERPDRPASAAIQDLLANDAASARAEVVVGHAAGRTPSAADESEEAPAEAISGEVFVLASLPQTEGTVHAETHGVPVFDPAARNAGADAAAVRDRQVAALQGSPRAALIGRTDAREPMLAIESGVRTTAKMAKPRVGQMTGATRRGLQVDTSPQVARWALEPNRVVEVSNATTAPSFAYNIVRTPPRVVYTDGFSQGSAQPDANRFTGGAVRFLSVARFN